MSTKALAAICRRHFVQRLSFFGSITRDDFEPDSDVDVLAEFHPERTISLENIVGLGDQLSVLFVGPTKWRRRRSTEPEPLDLPTLQLVHTHEYLAKLAASALSATE